MNEQNYGFVFNEITIQDNIFYKTYKTSAGKKKINHEIEFYKYILMNQIPFPMPTLVEHGDGYLAIEYIKTASTLTNENPFTYIPTIQNQLSTIHSIIIPIPPEIIHRDVEIEVKKKVMDRFREFDWTANPIYPSIVTVNGVQIHPIETYCDQIHNRLQYLLKHRNTYQLIHGDVHLGNILVDNENQKQLWFIDPRGYFGESRLFGLKEYDYAKLMFGVSGYSIFDTMVIPELNIENGNLHIEWIHPYELIFENPTFDEITRLFCLSIWLANNSCFTNINKKITSLTIASYYCEKYLR